MVAVALAEFSVHYDNADPELSRAAWQLAASRLVDHFFQICFHIFWNRFTIFHRFAVRLKSKTSYQNTIFVLYHIISSNLIG
ncbi:hypothetical protein C488_15422 [Natrinema pellirubrum DSM 15624]|uniref:Uncharacterized protein n=1 Tax=Natrinema pellirubrum (strain DSM 15624 / CIP 106293 / JCM 10476 / NCIMB 786 / 157) TaxID=797303 RepID=L9YF50_NATP1|nr:hypothetical protein C488_15422 [Natrinema pellirubrum DSM 15624]